MKTNALRSLIKTQLNTLKPTVDEVYYRVASDSAMYPHIVFSFERTSVNSDDVVRDNVTLVVDVWAKDSPATAEDIADSVEAKLHNKNLPQTTILPTIYLENKGYVLDEDKKIQHIQIKFNIQNYERN